MKLQPSFKPFTDREMSQLQEFRDRYLTGDGEKVTEELHQLTIDELVIALQQVGISHPRSYGRPKALQKAAAYIVNDRRT